MKFLTTMILSLLCSAAFSQGNIGNQGVDAQEVQDEQGYQSKMIDRKIDQAKSSVDTDKNNIQRMEAKKIRDQDTLDLDDAALKKGKAQLQEDKTKIQKFEDTSTDDEI